MTLRTTYRKSVLDLVPSRAVGVSLPFNGNAVFNSTFTTREQLKSNIINLVLTEPGERINEPEFGVGIKRYIFESEIAKDDLLANIKYQASIFTPELEIQELIINPVSDKNQIQLNLIYKIRNEGTIENVQININ